MKGGDSNFSQNFPESDLSSSSSIENDSDLENQISVKSIQKSIEIQEEERLS